jgi:5-methyltetrahydropteroyltriglutamate--homocysteine methyltransferase
LKLSTDRILTTHVGSLPRSQRVTELVFARERGDAVPDSEFGACIAAAVSDVVSHQARAGVDIVSDGEMSKISYATYIKDRLTGFDGDSERNAPADLEDYPNYLRKLASAGGTPTYRRPRCVGPIAVKSLQPLEDDLAWLRAALGNQGVAEAFMNSASPGVIALFQPNDYYPSHESYLAALAEAMRHEYEAIVEAGFLLQIDAPDLGLGGHTLFKGRPRDEYVRLANLHVEVLNHALRNCPADRLRMHVCWGNYEGPHHHDVPMDVVLPIALRAKPQGLLFEASNPRHAHEWTVFRDAARAGSLPQDKVLIPGVLDSVTNFVEHPLLVAERIERFAEIVGRDRVIAGSDCGFSTFAGFGVVDPDIVYAKLASMAEGARIASERLWGRASLSQGNGSCRSEPGR